MESADPPVSLSPSVRVEIVYGSKTGDVRVIKQELKNNASIKQAIEQSGILAMYPEIDLDRNKVGIFSKKKELQDVVQDGDRIEIYRPLLVDPKEARRRRAKNN